MQSTAFRINIFLYTTQFPYLIFLFNMNLDDRYNINTVSFTSSKFDKFQ